MGKPKEPRLEETSKQIIKQFQKAGCEVENGGKHYKIDCPDVEGTQTLSNNLKASRDKAQHRNLENYYKAQLKANEKL